MVYEELIILVVPFLFDGFFFFNGRNSENKLERRAFLLEHIPKSVRFLKPFM